jgi:hypothetical protein
MTTSRLRSAVPGCAEVFANAPPTRATAGNSVCAAAMPPAAWISRRLVSAI